MRTLLFCSGKAGTLMRTLLRSALGSIIKFEHYF
jgi:hypothetical protein